MSDAFPIGAVTAFAGHTDDNDAAAPSEYWLLCDGAPLSINDSKYNQLFEAIGFTYGGSEQKGVFNLPDYRGRFLRGADHGTGVDPDAAERRHHADELPRDDGTFAPPAGGKVGSIQEGATGRPHTPFEAALPHLPKEEKHTAATIFSPPKAAAWKGGSRTIDTCNDGGDPESRPVNVYVNYHIKCANPDG